MAASAGAFNQKTIIWLAVIVAVLLILSFVLDTFATDFFGTQSSGNDSYSRSAVGHKALMKTLEEVGIRVFASRSESTTSRPESALIVAEPVLTGDDDERRFTTLIDHAYTVLLVLPKWLSMESAMKPEFASAVFGADEGLAYTALDLIEEPVDSWELINEVAVSEWRMPSDMVGEPEIPRAQLLAANSSLRPIIECDEGVLFGEIHASGGASVYVLSDPDLIANHGLQEGDNGVIAVQIIDNYLRYGDMAVVFDETCHGHLGGDTAIRKAFRFPLVLATTQFLIIIGLLLWSGLGRFGAPRYVPEHLEAGKELLISNSAALYHFSGHSGQALHRFFNSTVQEVTDRFNVPASLSRSEHVEWLQGLSDSRQVGMDLHEIQASVASLRNKKRRSVDSIPRVARKIQQWKRKILNVPGTNPRRQ